MKIARFQFNFYQNKKLCLLFCGELNPEADKIAYSNGVKCANCTLGYQKATGDTRHWGVS
jgi:hypothetical protein